MSAYNNGLQNVDNTKVHFRHIEDYDSRAMIYR